jgi:hypothetical protein
MHRRMMMGMMERPHMGFMRSGMGARMGGRPAEPPQAPPPAPAQ